METLVHNGGTLPLLEHKLGYDDENHHAQTEWNRARSVSVYHAQGRFLLWWKHGSASFFRMGDVYGAI